MAQGTIKKLVLDRGFGFVSGDRGDIFFHHSVVQQVSFEDLHEGQAVEYEVDEAPGGRGAGKGPRASLVRPN